MQRTLGAALDESSAAIGRLDAHVIIAHLLGVNRAYLVSHRLRLLNETEDAKIDLMVAQRALGRPVAYLLEKREFYGREFALGPAVLIPRPETEVLVGAALERMPLEARAVDLGTGCGAIAITLACERRGARVVATDTSEAALELARVNADSLGATERLEFAYGSWYAPLGAARFDLIVANPPYVALHDPHLGRGDLRFEPPQALSDGSPDGLDSIRAIVAGAREHLNPGGWLLLEHGYDQRDRVSALMSSAGLADLISIVDLAGIPRVAGGKIA